jgi:hypothetical protein
MARLFDIHIGHLVIPAFCVSKTMKIKHFAGARQGQRS